jgi:hypothetical protein
MTNKYAERFGLKDSDRQYQAFSDRQIGTFGADKQGYSNDQFVAEVSAYEREEKATDPCMDRCKQSFDHYCVQRSYTKKEEKASHHKGSRTSYRDEPIGSHFCRYE